VRSYFIRWESEEDSALRISEAGGDSGQGLGTNGGAESYYVESSEGVGDQGDSRADFVQFGGALVDVGFDPDFAQSDRGGQAADSSTDYEDFHFALLCQDSLEMIQSMRKWNFLVAESILDDRFSELRRVVDSEVARARKDVATEVGRALARMRAAGNGEDWQEAVLESGRACADDPAVLELLGSLAALTAPSVSAALGPEASALRFAKVKIAEIQLYQAEAVKAGRAARDLYATLQPQIDAARGSFKERFLTNGSATADYLHAELIRALANDDATLLGPGYPGALI
jgi:hypothetical protein